MRAVVIYESLTGHTRDAGNRIAAGLSVRGVDTIACPVTHIDYQALSDADLVIIGSWTDGIFVVGQRPGRAGRLMAMPTLEGKRCLVYCTYAINPGKVLDKMTAIVESRGGTVLGGMAIRRNNIAGGVEEFVGRVLSNVAG
ncbi:MAG: flavodoxin family protein [Acidimicrobiales bacterium]